MGEQVFSVFVLTATVGFCFVTLTVFFGIIKAYVAIGWVPLAALLAVHSFAWLPYQPESQIENIEYLLDAVKWTSFLQGLLGLLVTAHAISNQKDWALPAAATVLAFLPLALR